MFAKVVAVIAAVRNGIARTDASDSGSRFTCSRCGAGFEDAGEYAEHLYGCALS
jgi:uncharacterized C2H2 Zn-finger protein